MSIRASEVADGELAELRSRFGNKAAEMVKLHRLAGSAVRVPECLLIEVAALRACTSSVDVMPSLPAGLPTVDQSCLAEDTISALQRPLFDLIAPQVAPSSFLKTSIVWKGAAGDERPPGIDVAVGPYSTVGPAFPARLVNGMYKAYTAACFAEAGRTLSRLDAGAIVMEAVTDIRAKCLGYIHPEGIFADLSVEGRPDYLGELRATDALPSDVKHKLLGVLQHLGDSEGRLVEVDVAVNARREVFIMQRTLVSTHIAGVLNGVGAVEGQVVDLRRLPRSAASVRALLKQVATANSIVIVPLLDAECVDAFALWWAVWRSGRHVAPRAIVVTHGPGSFAGLRNHLRHMISRFFRNSLIVRANELHVPSDCRSLRVKANGITASFVFS